MSDVNWDDTEEQVRTILQEALGDAVSMARDELAPKLERVAKDYVYLMARARAGADPGYIKRETAIVEQTLDLVLAQAEERSRTKLKAIAMGVLDVGISVARKAIL